MDEQEKEVEKSEEAETEETDAATQEKPETRTIEQGKDETILGKYNLNSTELKEFADEMAKALQEKSLLEDELVSVKSQYKSKLDGLDAKIRRNSSIYRSGYEYRDMDCHVELNFKTKHRSYYRKDTGEFVGSEPLKNEDYQIKMDM